VDWRHLLISAQADLESDPITRGRPIVLQSKDCHAQWVSNRVMEMSKPFGASIEGGIVLSDDRGAPTGTMLLISVRGD
jgi:predicted amidohydrolase YtcJ